MSIPLERESAMYSTVGGMEHCCMCQEPTPTWTNLPDRLPGQQVALCEVCAEQATPIMIPSKRAWCDLERARYWASGGTTHWGPYDEVQERAMKRLRLFRRHARAQEAERRYLMP